MTTIVRVMICGGLLAALGSSAQAVPLFGAFTRGGDLVLDLFPEDGGAGSGTASVSGDTFAADATFDPGSTYLPILRAWSTNIDPIVDDDRTFGDAEAYQAFTSSISQTVVLNITLDSIVTNSTDGNSHVLSNVWVATGSNFQISDTFCLRGEFMFDGVYLCGDEVDRVANLSNTGNDPTFSTSYSFSVDAGDEFGIFVDLTANSYYGSADAFNTLSLTFKDDSGLSVLEVPPVGPAPVPAPASAWLLGMGLAGLVIGRRRRLTWM